jgi:hypothetical protein
MSTKYDFGIKIDGATQKTDWNRSDETSLRKLYGDEDSYEQDVKGTLDIIHQNLAGKVLLILQDETAPHLTIVPYTDHDSVNLNVQGDIDVCNASTQDDGSPDAHPKGEYWYPNSDHPGGRGRIYDVSKDEGTGKGSDVRIHFTPRIFRNPGGLKAPCDNGGHYGRLPEEVLFHEMVHAFRKMSGHDLGRPTEYEPLIDYDNDEEFLAIVMTNVFISAFGRNTNLRADHHGATPLQPPQNTSKGFLSIQDNVDTLLRYYTQEFQLYQNMALIPDDAAQFNPFRELVFNGAEYGHPEVQPTTTWGNVWGNPP